MSRESGIDLWQRMLDEDKAPHVVPSALYEG